MQCVLGGDALVLLEVSYTHGIGNSWKIVLYQSSYDSYCYMNHLLVER